jgi:uncharacterized membrane protein
MAPAFEIALLWLAFGGTHVALTAGPVRGPIVRRLGEGGFAAVFSLIAAVSFAALVTRYAQLRFTGAPGLALGTSEPLRVALMGLGGAGVVLAIVGLVSYPRLPSAVFGQRIAAPRGIERVTRHPFFVGVALLAVAHVLLATRLAGVAFFAGFALLAVGGAWHQDRKLLARRGEPYRAYLAATSLVPFAAIVAGRQRLAWRDVPVAALVVGVAAALALRAAHPSLFARDGLWIVVATVTGAMLATVQAWMRARRIGGERALVGVGWAIVGLGAAHVLVTPEYEPQLGWTALWFASGGGAFILVGFLNVYRRRYATAAPALATVSTVANVVTLVFVAALGVVAGASPSHEPQVLVAIALMLAATAISLRRPRHG